MAISEDIKPVSFSFNNTGRCQSRCITCAAWETPANVAEQELTTQEWKDIISKMHDWLGDFTFIFSGGEPFLRDDIFELAQHAKDLGVKVDVVTNGLALTDKCEKVVDSALNVIVFSLNSVQNPSFHTDSRGRKDSFKKTMDVIQNVNYLNRKKNAGKGISLSSIIMPSNLSEIKPIAEFAKTEGIAVCFQLLDNGDAFILPPDSNLSGDGFAGDITEKAIAAFDLMIELKNQDYPICNSFAQIDAFKSLMQKAKNAPKIAVSDELVQEHQSQTNDLTENIQEAPQNNVSNEMSENPQCESEINSSDDLSKNIQELPQNPVFSDIVENFEETPQCNISNDIAENHQFEFEIDAVNLHEDPQEVALIDYSKVDIANLKCQVGYNNFSIDPYGDVRICFCFESIGSLKDESPADLWRSEKADILRDKISKCPRSCKLLNCNFKD